MATKVRRIFFYSSKYLFAFKAFKWRHH